MITLRRVTDPVTLPCPYCGAPILTADEAKEAVAMHAKSLHGEPDLIEDMHQHLTPEQRVPNAVQCFIDVGEASCCEERFFFVEAIMVNRNLDPRASQADSDFISQYFFFNGGRGPATHFMASRGKREWLVRRFESPYDPRQNHKRLKSLNFFSGQTLSDPRRRALQPLRLSDPGAMSDQMGLPL